MEYPIRGRKVKIKVCLNGIFSKRVAETLKASKLYSSYFDMDDRDKEGIALLHEKLRKNVTALIINDLDVLGAIAFETELYREEDEFQKRDYINIRSKNYKKPTIGEILDDLDIYEEMLDWANMFNQIRKKLPIEIKISKAARIENYLCNIEIKERNHTTDIVQNENYKSKLKIIKFLNVFFVKRHLKEFLLYDIVRRDENDLEQQYAQGDSFDNEIEIVEETKSENESKISFNRIFKENKELLNRKRPPDKNKSLMEKVEKIEIIEKRKANYKHVKHKAVKTQCSIEEQRRYLPKRIKPPDKIDFELYQI